MGYSPRRIVILLVLALILGIAGFLSGGKGAAQASQAAGKQGADTKAPSDRVEHDAGKAPDKDARRDDVEKRVRSMLEVKEGELGMIALSPEQREKWFSKVPSTFDEKTSPNYPTLLSRKQVADILEEMIGAGERLSAYCEPQEGAGHQRPDFKVELSVTGPPQEGLIDLRIAHTCGQGPLVTSLTLSSGSILLVRTRSVPGEALLVVPPVAPSSAVPVEE
jgi:hypothetical protein